MPAEPLRVGDWVRVWEWNKDLQAHGYFVSRIEMGKHNVDGSWYRLRLPSGQLTGWLRAEGLERVEES